MLTNDVGYVTGRPRMERGVVPKRRTDLGGGESCLEAPGEWRRMTLELCGRLPGVGDAGSWSGSHPARYIGTAANRREGSRGGLHFHMQMQG